PKKAVANPDVFVCDACAAICLRISDEDERRLSAELPPVDSSLSPLARCSLCRVHAPASDCLLVPDRGVFCPGCLMAMNAAVDGERVEHLQTTKRGSSEWRRGVNRPLLRG